MSWKGWEGFCRGGTGLWQLLRREWTQVRNPIQMVLMPYDPLRHRGAGPRVDRQFRQRLHHHRYRAGHP